MREFKFRAWDNKNKIMTAKVSLSDVLKGFLGLENNVVMQYTGLKDKNGIETYEGDIISCQNKIGQVKYEESMFVVDFERTKGHLFTISDKCEIIGNIYKNPELLKES